MKKTEKTIIYQVFPRLFGNTTPSPVKHGSLVENGVGKFASFTPEALQEIKSLGVTHIWYTGVIEHATKTDYSMFGIKKDHGAVVKGKAGSPYAIKDYYDVDPDLAESVPHRMSEFEALIRRTHEAGMKVLIDFVPNHVARQYYSDVRPVYVDDLGYKDNTSVAFDANNNFYYIPGQPLALPFGAKQEDFEYSEFPAKVTGNDHFDAYPGRNDWFETVKLNYGVDYVNGRKKYFDPVPDTWTKMLDILLFWVGKGVDGFRCDMAEMVPVEFWNWVIPRVKQAAPVCFIAEVYNPAEYRNYLHIGYFDYLYDKVGLYDTLRAVVCNQLSAGEITRCWQSLEGIQTQMLNFLENHDEQRIASDFFAGNPLAGIPGMIVAALMNTNPVMIYAGQELGEPGMDEEGFSGRDGRTTIFDYWSVASLRNWIDNGTFKGRGLTDAQWDLRGKYSRILQIARSEPAMVNGTFYDLMYANQGYADFDPHRSYAFLRKYKDDTILVVANFSDREQLMRIRIPEDAFHSLQLKDNQAAIQTDLFTGASTLAALTSAWPFQVQVPAFGGVVLKFSVIA